MSDKTDTPLTDAAEFTSDTFNGVDRWEGERFMQAVPADFARDLERQLAEARKDTVRLDWLEANGWKFVASLDGFSYRNLDVNRQAIDQAMKEEQI